MTNKQKLKKIARVLGKVGFINNLKNHFGEDHELFQMIIKKYGQKIIPTSRLLGEYSAGFSEAEYEATQFELDLEELK